MIQLGFEVMPAPAFELHELQARLPGGGRQNQETSWSDSICITWHQVQQDKQQPVSGLKEMSAIYSLINCALHKERGQAEL